MQSLQPAGARGRPGRPRLRCLAACLTAVIALLAPPAVRAEVPADVLPRRGVADLAIPALPEGYVQERVGHVTWGFHRSALSAARELERKLPEAWKEIGEELGSDAPDDLTVRIARGPEDMARLAPAGAPPPAYAVGVAYPALGLVILSVVSPGSWLPPDLASVLTHELSHVALHRTVQGKPLPLWFVEGMAVHQANEQNLARVQTLWEAAVVDEVLPLSELSAHFPSRPHEVNRAYAESADAVEHMLREDSGRERMRNLLARVAAGASFEDAVLAAYDLELPYLDHQWREQLHERFRVLPLVLTGTALWGGIALLAVMAFVRRRKDHRAKLQRWESEEAAYDRAMAALELQRQAALREQLLHAQGGAVPPPLPLDSGVPTIEHEGQRYTLH